ncbi:MAG: hypothetical protein H6679_01165 [Epsilonproteobacteria bacterium]|nr:hypothetical protein [Campylobacterota bacterium]
MQACFKKRCSLVLLILFSFVSYAHDAYLMGVQQVPEPMAVEEEEDLFPESEAKAIMDDIKKNLKPRVFDLLVFNEWFTKEEFAQSFQEAKKALDEFEQRHRKYLSGVQVPDATLAAMGMGAPVAPMPKPGLKTQPAPFVDLGAQVPASPAPVPPAMMSVPSPMGMPAPTQPPSMGAGDMVPPVDMGGPTPPANGAPPAMGATDPMAMSGPTPPPAGMAPPPAMGATPAPTIPAPVVETAPTAAPGLAPAEMGMVSVPGMGGADDPSGMGMDVDMGLDMGAE